MLYRKKKKKTSFHLYIEEKEVKRNRIEVSLGLKNNCKRTQRWPYVCTGCKDKYNNCPFTKYNYDPIKAQQKADTNLVNSRKGRDEYPQAECG